MQKIDKVCNEIINKAREQKANIASCESRLNACRDSIKAKQAEANNATDRAIYSRLCDEIAELERNVKFESNALQRAKAPIEKTEHEENKAKLLKLNNELLEDRGAKIYKTLLELVEQVDEYINNSEKIKAALLSNDKLANIAPCLYVQTLPDLKKINPASIELECFLQMYSSYLIRRQAEESIRKNKQ